MNQSDSKYMAAAANRGKIYDIVSRKLEQRSITTTATKRDKMITPARQDKSDARV